jgi:hypothetical protein
MKCKLVPVDDRVWALYSAWHKLRGLEPPVPGAYAWIFLAAQLPEGPTLMSGAMVIQHARELILDRFVANPYVSTRTALIAGLETIRAACTLSTLLGKRLLVEVDEASQQRLLRRLGWVMYRKGPLMVAEPGFDFEVAHKTKAPRAGGALAAPLDTRDQDHGVRKSVQSPAKKGKAAIAEIRRRQQLAEDAYDVRAMEGDKLGNTMPFRKTRADKGRGAK